MTTPALPAVRYPAGPITPHGAYHLLRGKIPMLWLTAHDESIRFDLMGGLSIIDHTRPESVHIKRDGLTGLVPPWKQIKQKGATQDGITFIDALGDPIEVQIKAVARGRDGGHLRTVVRHLTTSIDPIQPAGLNFWTNELGHWWSDVRWMKTLPGSLSGARQHLQPVDLMLEAADGYWQTDADTDAFEFDPAGPTVQEGFLTRVNVGDQKMYDDYTIFGPATLVKFWNGPGSDDYVTFGPVLPNQIMYIRTDPRNRGVQDLTATPATPQEHAQYQDAIAKLSGFVVNLIPLLDFLQSPFGVATAQGEPFSLMKGRFSDDAAIPPKSPGEAARPYHVKVSIDGGAAGSKVLASGIPRRRLPV